MATINVLLEARAKDKGVKKFFRDATKLADKFTASAELAAKAGRKLEGINVGGLTTGRGGGGAAGGRAPRQTRGSGRDPIAASMKAIARDRARMGKAQNRQAAQVVKQQVAAGRRETRVLTKQLKERERQSRQIKNLSRAQLEQLEIENEITKRRRRAARQSAQTRLGPDPTSRKGQGLPGKGRLSVGADLAIAGAEFEQFGAQVEQGIRTSFNAFKDFEKGVVEVSTLTDQIPIDQIRKITQDAAAEFGGLPTSQVSAFYSIVSAGATDATSATEQLVAANKLAIGGVATQEQAVLAISKAVANFGDQGITAAKASDILFAAVQRGQTTVPELASALPNVANAAAAAGLRMEDAAAALSFLSTKMPSAAEASTGLSAALSNIEKASKGALETADDLGIDFSRAGIKAAGGFEEFLLQLRSAEGFDDETLGKLFESKRARQAIGTLLADMEGFNSVLGDTENSAGKAEQAFTKMSDTSAQKAAKFEAQLELLKIQAGEALVPALIEVADAVTPIVKGVGEFIKENPNAVKTIAKLTIAAAVFGRTAGLVASGLSMWSTLSGIAANKTGALTAKTAAATVQTKAYGKAQRGMGAAMGALPAVFIGAQAAILAFNLILDQAQKPLSTFEGTLDRIAAKQQKISFKTAEGKDKTEKDLLLERRERLVQAAKGAQQLRRVGSGGRAFSEVKSGNVAAGFGQAFGGLLNKATGTTGEFERQETQTQLDLARFDREFGEKAGIAESDRQAAPIIGEGLTELLALTREQIDATRSVADNTSSSNDVGPSMDAGLI